MKKNFNLTFTMPDPEEMVINTGPILAIVAALGNLQPLRMYRRVWVPYEVGLEILAGGSDGFAVAEFKAAHWLQKVSQPLKINPMLENLLDPGEASVIQLALNERVRTVCIDETRGRRTVRLNGLLVTGSIGILLRAKREGYAFSMPHAIAQMRDRGVWLSQRVIDFALTQTDE